MGAPTSELDHAFSFATYVLLSCKRRIFCSSCGSSSTVASQRGRFREAGGEGEGEGDAPPCSACKGGSATAEAPHKGASKGVGRGSGGGVAHSCECVGVHETCMEWEAQRVPRARMSHANSRWRSSPRLVCRDVALQDDEDVGCRVGHIAITVFVDRGVDGMKAMKEEKTEWERRKVEHSD